MEEARTRPIPENGERAFLKSMRCRSLERTFLENTAAGYASSGEIVAICADPGMGKTQIATAIARRIPSDETEVISLSGLDGELAGIRLTKAARRIGPRLRKGSRICVIVDDICPADEYDVERIDRSILRLQKLGAYIILTMRPEAEQVLDGLDRNVRIGKDDLMMSESDLAPLMRAKAIMGESGGVPELVDVLQTHPPMLGVPDAFLPAFGETLSRIARDSLRDTLLDEERMVRFAAMLLGNGTWDELQASAGGQHPREAASALSEAALVLVDHAAKTFRCIGLEDDIGLMYCSEVLCRAVDLWPDVAAAAAGVLVERGEVRRASRIANWLDPERRCALGLRYGLDFLNAGETAIVRDALAAPSYSEDVSPHAFETLSWAYGSVWSQDVDAADACPNRDFATAVDERDHRRAKMLAHARELLGDASCVGSIESFDRSDGMAAALSAHIDALALLECGRMGDCCSLLKVKGPYDAGETFAGALLAIDEEVARMLAFDQEPPDYERMRLSEEYFERMGFSPLVGWGGIVGSIRDAIAGIVAPHGLDAAAALAERRGNTVLAAALCCAVALTDLLRKVPVNAHVKAAHAISLAEKGSCHAISDIAAIFLAISADCIDEPAAYRRLARRSWSCEGLESIGGLVCEALSEDGWHAKEAPVPYDYLWLVKAIANLPGAMSRRFRMLLHPTWQKHLSELENGEREQENTAIVAIDTPPEQVHQPYASLPKVVEIRLLGEFTVLVDGVEIPARTLVSRSAGNVLALLAAVPAHSLKRVELIDSVWPGTDYVTGRDRIYQAVCRIRKLVKEIDEDLEPIALARNDGIIRFNAGQVTCDVDDFAEAARTVMGVEGSEEEVIEAVQRMEALYRGRLFMPPQDGAGVMRGRDRELRRLFSDAMVLGSEAALRMGKRRLAVHFAERAARVESSREDVACTLIRALKAAGRQGEAVKHYRSFVKRASRSKGWRPSKELRESIGSLIVDQGQPPSPFGGADSAVRA